MNIEYLKTPEIIQPDAIKFVRKDRINSSDFYAELSNFQKTDNISDYDFSHIFYDCVENYYQAAKTTDIEIKRKLSISSAYVAKKSGSNLKLRDDWDVLKFQVMWLGLKEKFNQPKFKEILLSTENKQIIEWCWWG